jgi:hypothetical protein
MVSAWPFCRGGRDDVKSITMMLSYAFFLLAQAATPPIPTDTPATLQVESDSTCPSADEVRHALTKTPLANVTEPLTVLVAVTDNQLSMTFRNAGWEVVGARQITVSTECGERAGSAAIVIAAWLNTDGGRPATAVVLTPLQPIQKKPEVTTPKTAPALTRQNELSVGGGLSISGTARPAASIEFARAFEHSGLGWFVAGLGSYPRQLDLGSGTSRWSRTSILAGPRARMPFGRLRGDLDVGVLATAVSGWGSGYAEDRRGTGLTSGLTTGIRITFPGQFVSVWFETRLLWWPETSRILVGSVTQPTSIPGALPGTEFLFVLGLRHASQN